MSWGITDGDDVDQAYMRDLIEGALGDGKPAQAASYVVFLDGSTYKARDGTDGKIDYKGTNFGTVIQSVIDGLTAGGRISLHQGTHNVPQTVNGADKIEFQGEGRTNTVLNWTGAANGVMFNFEEKSHFGFKDMEFKGADSAKTAIETGTTGAGNRTRYLTLDRLTFSNFEGAALDFGLADGRFTDELMIRDSLFDNNVVGIDGWLNQVQLFDVDFGGSEAETHVLLRGSTESTPNLKAYGCTFARSNYDVEIKSDTAIGGLIFVGCWFESTVRSWIARTTVPASSKTVHAIVFMDCELGVPTIHNETYPILDLTNTITGATIIGGNLCVNPTKTATVKTAESETCVLIQGINNGELFVMDGVTRSIRGNLPDYVVEKMVQSPTFAIDSTGVKTVTIAHGLASTPPKKNCQLTVLEDTDVDDWAYNLLKVDSADATNVTAKINVSSASSTGGATARLALKANLFPEL